MTIRKIDLMHREFGKLEGKTCKDCSNLYRRKYDKTYIKCRVYGNSCSEATDWKVSNVACGMFNKEWDGNEIVRNVTRIKEVAEPLEGQVGLW